MNKANKYRARTLSYDENTNPQEIKRLHTKQNYRKLCENKKINTMIKDGKNTIQGEKRVLTEIMENFQISQFEIGGMESSENMNNNNNNNNNMLTFKSLPQSFIKTKKAHIFAKQTPINNQKSFSLIKTNQSLSGVQSNNILVILPHNNNNNNNNQKLSTFELLKMQIRELQSSQILRHKYNNNTSYFGQSKNNNNIKCYTENNDCYNNNNNNNNNINNNNNNNILNNNNSSLNDLFHNSIKNNSNEYHYNYEQQKIINDWIDDFGYITNNQFNCGKNLSLVEKNKQKIKKVFKNNRKLKNYVNLNGKNIKQYAKNIKEQGQYAKNIKEQGQKLKKYEKNYKECNKYDKNNKQNNKQYVTMRRRQDDYAQKQNYLNKTTNNGQKQKQSYNTHKSAKILNLTTNNMNMTYTNSFNNNSYTKDNFTVNTQTFNIQMIKSKKKQTPSIVKKYYRPQSCTKLMRKNEDKQQNNMIMNNSVKYNGNNNKSKVNITMATSIRCLNFIEMLKKQEKSYQKFININMNNMNNMNNTTNNFNRNNNQNINIRQRLGQKKTNIINSKSAASQYKKTQRARSVGKSYHYHSNQKNQQVYHHNHNVDNNNNNIKKDKLNSDDYFMICI